jgi:alpha-tubulin suppressor-like RCC1 family protein
MNAPKREPARIFCTLSGALLLFVAAGAAAAELPAGRVRAWGDNSFGQTNVPLGATNVVALSARGELSMALKADGQVLVWPQFLVGPTPAAAGNCIAIAAGGGGGAGHCVALTSSGRVIAWGANDAGQTNVHLAGLSNVTAIAAGVYHNLLVRDGVVYGWGQGTYGKTATPAIGPVVAVAAGLDHSVALRADGGVSAWGRNTMNQLAVPASDRDITAIAAGANHTLALRRNGTVRAWGANNGGQTNLARFLSNVMAIGAGDDHSLVVFSNGLVFAWGNTSAGQTNVPAGVSNVIAVTGGLGHSLALQLEPLTFASEPASQTVMQGATVSFSAAVTGSTPIRYQWRKSTNASTNAINNATNSSITLFNVTTNDIAAYSVVVSNPLGSITSSNAVLQVNVPVSISQHPTNDTVGVGSSVTFRVVAGGTAPIRYQWKRNGTNISLALSSSYTIGNVQFSHAGTYTVAVSNDFGGVVSQPAVLTVHSGPVISQQPQSQTVIAGGSATFTVVSTNATSYEWRKNGTAIPNETNSVYTIDSAQSSDAGTYSVRLTNPFGSVISDDAILTVTMPASSSRVVGWGEQIVWNGSAWIDVSPPTNLGTVVAVAIGEAHSLALRSDGTVVGWGDNTYGQAGSPTQATNVIAIAAGMHHSVALRGDGRIVAWGRNDNWQQTTLPTHSNVIAIACGADHSLAVQSNGVVVGWGRNNDGRATPPPTLGASRKVGAGSDHSLGVRNDTTVRGWGGQNLHGERTIPAGLSNVIAVAAGANHSMALRSNGTVVVWGNNSFGQTNVPAFAAPVKTIAAGTHHCLALLQNGSVVAWGNGNDGQTNIPTVNAFTAIAAGFNRNLAIKPRQLVLRRPQRLITGRHWIFLSNDDGAAPTPEQTLRVQVFASTNLSAAGDWIRLTNPITISSGNMRIEDSQTNLPRRFYRARENP